MTTTGFDQTMAQIQMTLSAIAYTAGAKDPTMPDAEDIRCNLANANYSTGGEWGLVWGPGYSTYDDNMMFVVQHRSDATYAVVIRGTEAVDLYSWFEDVPTGMTDYADYTDGETTRVSDKFANAIKYLEQSAKDPATGATIESFLDSVADGQSKLTLYVTGHSQGGGLVPIMSAWLHAKSKKWTTTQTTIISYGFAPPTSGDTKFANWIAANIPCYYVANPHDIVPYAYNRLSDIIADEVPISVPKDITVKGYTVNLHDIIDGANIAMKAIADFHLTSWAQAGQAQPTIPPAGIVDPDGGEYTAQVGFQHSHDTYLQLLGAYYPVSLKPAPGG